MVIEKTDSNTHISIVEIKNIKVESISFPIIFLNFKQAFLYVLLFIPHFIKDGIVKDPIVPTPKTINGLKIWFFKM